MATWHGKMCLKATLSLLLLVTQHLYVAPARKIEEMGAPQGSPLVKPKAPSSRGGYFVLGRYKKDEVEAFRPTTPGGSPGMGHGNPPGNHA